MADFIKNAWYVAGWINELADTPIRRKIISRDVLLYRDTNGEVVALGNICPHRFAPLHEGKIVGDLIECPYHGLRYDRTGACVYNPFTQGTEGIPPRMQVHHYPVYEKYRYIWVWMGDPALAKEEEIPDFSFLDEADEYTATSEAVLSMPVNYELILDNLMDLSHAQFLHPTTLGNASMTSSTGNTFTEGNVVYSQRLNLDGAVPQLFAAAQLVPEGEHVDFWNDMFWAPGSCYYLEVGITPVGRPREEGVFIRSAQLLTPVDETATDYRHILYRNFLHGNDEVTAAMEALVSTAFSEEDEPMLLEVQANMDGRDFWDMKPGILKGDRAGIMVRRMRQKLLKQEKEAQKAA